MSKNKYAPDGGVKTDGGERKQRDHTKTGKLAAKREGRRLDAINRQERRIQVIQAVIKGGKSTKDLTEYMAKFKTPQEALAHADLTLKQIRGGISHDKLTATKVETPVAAPVVAEEAPLKTGKKKSNYSKRKQKRTEKSSAE